MINILSVCNHPEILKIMDRLVNQQADWTSFTADSVTTAIQYLKKEDYDIVLLGAGIGPSETAQLQAVINNKASAPKLVNHYGGGSGLLYTEIKMALEGQRAT